MVTSILAVAPLVNDGCRCVSRIALRLAEGPLVELTAGALDLGLDHHFRNGTLINLLPDWSDDGFQLYVYYVSRSYVPAKMRRFIDFIIDSFGTGSGAISKYERVSGNTAAVEFETRRA